VILPENANALLKARMSGLAPSDPLIIVFTGKRYPNYDPIVYADPQKEYDWRFAKGLSGYVVWRSDLSGFDRHMRVLCKTMKQPVEYYVVDRQAGGSLFLLPNADDVDAVCEKRLDQRRMRWDLNDTPWMKWQNQDMQRFLKEVDLATGT
jgi:hypothetical protein